MSLGGAICAQWNRITLSGTISFHHNNIATDFMNLDRHTWSSSFFFFFHVQSQVQSRVHEILKDCSSYTVTNIMALLDYTNLLTEKDSCIPVVG